MNSEGTGPDPQPPRPPWFADGLSFECTQCGACCSGAPGYVLFTDDDAEAIAARLSIRREEFIERYTVKLPSEICGRKRSLREVETEHGLDCVFLDRATIPGKALCSIHDLRPSQCRTFPFWPEHIESPRAWQRLGRSCEGVGRGPTVSLTQIRIQVESHWKDRASVPPS